MRHVSIVAIILGMLTVVDGAWAGGTYGTTGGVVQFSFEVADPGVYVNVPVVFTASGSATLGGVDRS